MEKGKKKLGEVRAKEKENVRMKNKEKRKLSKRRRRKIIPSPLLRSISQGQERWR